MIRESMMTIKPVSADRCDIYCQTRDDNGPWGNKCVLPVFGTLEQVRTERIANQERWGWTLYDIEQGDVLTFWKEF